MTLSHLIDMASKVLPEPETQASVTTGASLAYFFTLNNIVGALTIILLLGQLGLVYLKYRDRRKKKEEDGPEE